MHVIKLFFNIAVLVENASRNCASIFNIQGV